jgi:hypothetical protein
VARLIFAEFVPSRAKTAHRSAMNYDVAGQFHHDGPNLTYADIKRFSEDAANALSPAASEWQPTHRHIGRGTEYEFLGWGRAQCSPSGLLDDEHVAIYRGKDGDLWARRLAEFNDGRFEVVSPVTLPSPPQQQEVGR